MGANFPIVVRDCMKTTNDILVSNLNGEFAAAIEATGREVNGSDDGPGAIGEYHLPQTPGPLSSGGVNLALLELSPE